MKNIKNIKNISVKKIRGVGVWLCASVLILFFHITARAAGPEINAPSAILMEKETGLILYEKDAHTSREPASVTKIMTILLTMEAIDNGSLSYQTEVMTSRHASSMGGSQIWLKENEVMTVEEMLKAVCVVSANDCAVALAEQLAGSEQAFVDRMNRRAAELGMNDTVFKNATGLPAVGHVTSAHDIAVMSRELIFNHPAIRNFTTIWMDTLRDGASQLVNTNKLLRDYNGITGLKTGSTSSAGYCLSATAERDGMELIAVILKGQTSDTRFRDARNLLDYGFASYILKTIKPEEPLPYIPVRLGELDLIQPVMESQEPLLLERSRAGNIRIEIETPEQIEAPIAIGDEIGVLRVYSDDEILKEIKLLSNQDISRVTWRHMLFKILETAFL